MPPDYLDRVLERWKPDTGLVCSPPVGTRPDGLGAELECAFLNTYQARWQLIADALGTAFAQGKTMFWRRDYLEEAGSIEALAAEPAEDAASTKLIRAAGRKVRLVIRPFPQPLGQRVARRRLAPPDALGAPAPLVLPAGLCAGGRRRRLLPAARHGRAGRHGRAADRRFPWPGWLHGTAPRLLLARRYDWPVSPRILVLMILRDLLLFPLWIVGWTGNTFVWRGNAMDIKNEGTPAATACRAVDDLSRGTFGASRLRPVGADWRTMERGNGAPPGG